MKSKNVNLYIISATKFLNFYNFDNADSQKFQFTEIIEFWVLFSSQIVSFCRFSNLHNLKIQ